MGKGDEERKEEERRGKGELRGGEEREEREGRVKNAKRR